MKNSLLGAADIFASRDTRGISFALYNFVLGE